MDFLSDKNTQLIIAMGLVGYVALMKPNLPASIKNLVNNTYVKIAVLSFIAWRANQNPMMSILLAVAFVITLNCATTGSLMENFSSVRTGLRLFRDGHVRESNNRLDFDKEYIILPPYYNLLKTREGFNGIYGLIARKGLQTKEIPIRYTWIQKDSVGNQMLFTDGGATNNPDFKTISSSPSVSNSNNNQSSGNEVRGYNHFGYFVRRTSPISAKNPSFQFITKVINKDGRSHDGKHQQFDIKINFDAKDWTFEPYFKLDANGKNLTSDWTGKTGDFIELKTQ